MTARARAQRRGPDRSLGLLRTGYPFLANLRRAGRSGVRLFGRATTVVGGSDGARFFYGDERLTRHQAVPSAVSDTLFGAGTVHGLDGEAHRHRKAMLVSLLTDQAAADVAARARAQWWQQLAAAAGSRLTLFDAASQIHLEAAAGWVGVPSNDRYPALAADLAALVDGSGSIAARHLRARWARLRAEAWARRIVVAVRGGDLAPAGSPLQVIATHRDEQGAPLSAQVAAVELLNQLRPAVAAAWFVAYAGLALHQFPRVRAQLEQHDPDALESFAHEVRRFYPMLPMLAARAGADLTWRGQRISRGEPILLDVYGTLHDRSAFPDPERFDPSRFVGHEPDPYTLIPQGGGDVRTGHRCPGERMTLELIKTATEALLQCEHELVPQDLSIPLNRLPSRPRSGIVIVPAG